MIQAYDPHRLVRIVSIGKEQNIPHGDLRSGTLHPGAILPEKHRRRRINGIDHGHGHLILRDGNRKIIFHSQGRRPHIHRQAVIPDRSHDACKIHIDGFVVAVRRVGKQIKRGFCITGAEHKCVGILRDRNHTALGRFYGLFLIEDEQLREHVLINPMAGAQTFVFHAVCPGDGQNRVAFLEDFPHLGIQRINDAGRCGGTPFTVGAQLAGAKRFPVQILHTDALAQRGILVA